MADRNKKKSSAVKGGAAANPAAMAAVESHKDDTQLVPVLVIGVDNSEADKVEEKTDVVAMQPIHVVGGEIETKTDSNDGKSSENGEESSDKVEPDPELERANRKKELTLLYNDDPQSLLTSPDLNKEDLVLIAEIASEQNQVVRDWATMAQELTDEKDQVERKLDAANSKLSNVTNLISNTVTQTMGQMDKEAAKSIEGLKTEIGEVIGKGNGVKNAVTKIGDDVNKDIGSLKVQISTNVKSVNDKVDGMAAMLGKIDEKISSNPNANNPVAVAPSSNWPWVVVVGLLLAAVTVIAVFFLSKDTKIEVQVQQAPAGNTMKIVPPLLNDDAARATSQQVVPGGPSNPLVPNIIIGANPADPCEGKTGKENGECTMNSRRPKDFPDQDWNTV
ncbi:MAG TPA: hypothetical protein PK295_01675, partial [Candidatus Magasanikbacteria bacterium]|nr:hypothetical protein [Candidatus Magasanikbacteria bacterium]